MRRKHRPKIDKAFAIVFAWLIVLIMGVSTIAFFQGCTAMTVKRTTLGLADWYVTNHEMLAIEIRNAPTVDHMNFLMTKVAPYMDLLKYGIIGMDAVDEKNTENMAHAARGLLRHGAKFDYDPTRLIAAIQAEDYDTIQVELLVLKNLIIVKWVKIQ